MWLKWLIILSILGKEGGKAGGDIIFSGSPEKLAECKESYTGKYLKPELADIRFYLYLNKLLFTDIKNGETG